MAIQFVGAIDGEISGTGGISLSLAALAGGIASVPSVGDLVVVFHGWASTTNGVPAVTSPAATLIAELYANDTNDANFAVSYFFYDGSTNIVTVNSVNAAVAAVQVWRGVSRTNPLDVAAATNTRVGGNTINPDAVTPITNNSAVLVAALIATETAGVVSTPPGFTSATNTARGGTTNIAANMRTAYKTGNQANVAVDPATMSCTTGGNGSSCISFTIALRESSGKIKYWNGSSWLGRSVKYWNGSSWVEKPVKRWNGSAWVVTNY